MRAHHHSSEPVALLDPFCELGYLTCRLMAMEGFRPVVISEDPYAGEAFCTRMALEGFSVPHRLVSPDLNASEERVASDLLEVMGGLRGMVSFFATGPGVREWLRLPIKAAEQLVQRETSRRIRLLRALVPLLRGSGFLQNVLMTEDGGRSDRLAGAAAALWDHVLADEWDREGVVVRRTVASLCALTPLSLEVRRIYDDFHRLMILTGQSAPA